MLKRFAKCITRAWNETVNGRAASARLGLNFMSYLFGMTGEDILVAIGGRAKEREPKSKHQMYWTTKSLTEIIKEADQLFSTGNFLEVYELLNRLKYNNNVEVQWRISRALFKMSRDENYAREWRNEMIMEAYSLMVASMDVESNNPRVYKWMAITLDAKNSIDNLEQRIKSFPAIMEYLHKAIELDPEDPVSLYLLGKMCFELSQMSTLQRAIAKFFYGHIPTASYEEAYEYLLKSYEIHPEAYYIPTMYMIGVSCFNMQQFFRARYYLNAAATLPPRTTAEKESSIKSKALLKRLDIYDLTKASFDFTIPF